MPTTSVLSNWAGNQALVLLLQRKGLYLAVHETDPGVTGDLATEVAGGGYIRQPILFSMPGSKTCASTNAQTFPGMPACVARYLAVWTAISGGQLIFPILLTPSITVPESGQLLAAAGDVALTL